MCLIRSSCSSFLLSPSPCIWIAARVPQCPSPSTPPSSCHPEHSTVFSYFLTLILMVFNKYLLNLIQFSSPHLCWCLTGIRTVSGGKKTIYNANIILFMCSTHQCLPTIHPLGRPATARTASAPGQVDDSLDHSGNFLFFIFLWKSYVHNNFLVPFPLVFFLPAT